MYCHQLLQDIDAQRNKLCRAPDIFQCNITSSSGETHRRLKNTQASWLGIRLKKHIVKTQHDSCVNLLMPSGNFTYHQV
jgi:hypothetical protein